LREIRNAGSSRAAILIEDMGNSPLKKMKLPVVEIACCYSTIEKRNEPPQMDLTDAATCTSEQEETPESIEEENEV